MNRKGTTLIETIISIFLVSVVCLTFLEALNIGITGTLNVNRRTSALNLAKSQIDYAKAESYKPVEGDLDDVYGRISNLSDTVNYNISGYVSNVSTDRPLQKISVNISYLVGQQVELTAYKTAEGSMYNSTSLGLLVTDVVPNVPTMPQGYGGLCLGSFRGYYHVFTTATAGPVSVHWKFEWEKMSSGIIDIGCPVIAIYGGTPNWTINDSMGVVRENGLIVRQQNGLWLGDVAGIGDLPGDGTGNVMCKPCDDDYYDPTEQNPLYYIPHSEFCPPLSSCSFFGGAAWWACLIGGYTTNNSYPCCGYSDSDDQIFWIYDSSGDSGAAEDTLVTGNLSPGTYTVLFFNSENMKNLDTVSASVSYYK